MKEICGLTLKEAIKRIEIHKECAGLKNGTCIVNIRDLETLLKELERLQEENNKLERANKTYINSIQSIAPVLLEDYIEKDKIKEKIEELVKFVGVAGMLVSEDEVSKAESQIEILEEILEEKVKWKKTLK